MKYNAVAVLLLGFAGIAAVVAGTLASDAESSAAAASGATVVVDKTSPPAVRCGDKVAIRSEVNMMFLTGDPKTLGASASAGLPGVFQIFVLECRKKKAGDFVEMGDAILFKSERVAGKYLNDANSDTRPLTLDPSKAKDFFVFAPFDLDDDQARQQLLFDRRFGLRSERAGLMTYISANHKGQLFANSDNTDADKTAVSFRLYHFPNDVDNYAANCPKNANGMMCSGNGVCMDRTCECNDDYLGEQCELARKSASCAIQGNTHISSFDTALYNSVELGEFLVYQEVNSNFKEAVAIFVGPWKSQENTSVIKKVTIRRNGADGEEFLNFDDGGNSVYYQCDSSANLAEAIKERGTDWLALRNGLKIQWASEFWEVLSPSRMRVRIKPEPKTGVIDVYIAAYTARQGTAEGLCGNNNDNPDDDMMPRATDNDNNTPAKEVMDHVRVNDGRNYPLKGTLDQRTKGVSNGAQSKAFYQCLAKPDYVQPEFTLVAARTGAGEEVSGNVRTTVDMALAAGFCAGKQDMQDSAAGCCRQVLVKARAIGDTDKAPVDDLQLAQLVSTVNLQKAWAVFTNPTIPDSHMVQADYIQCIEDICKTKSSTFCTEEKSDVEVQRNLKGDDHVFDHDKESKGRLQATAEQSESVAK